MWDYLVFGVAVRLLLLLYGEWQDRTMAVKYTDVDYFVFTDAAAYALQGASPYNRSTYRYTPLLAWMITPNAYFGVLFGKILFIAFDILAGYLIYEILISRGHNSALCKRCSGWWFLNPLPIIISSRGNAESIMACLVLLTLRCLQSKHTKTMSMIYGLSVHFKIYPIVYSLPLYFLLGLTSTKQKTKRWTDTLKYFLLPNKERLKFMIIAGTTILSLSAIFYHLYGFKFLEHSYLYHIKRRDIRHNFSVYFYMLYLIDEETMLGFLTLAVFVPQFLLLVVISVKFHRDPPFCWFLNTFIFVSFNKVCTSQYFLWYWCLIPLVLPELRMRVVKGWTLIGMWVLAQGFWLQSAYLLEFEGANTFNFLCLAGLVFFAVNMYIVKAILDDYRLDSWFLSPPKSKRFTQVKEKFKQMKESTFKQE